jgi:hypothetical protein
MPMNVAGRQISNGALAVSGGLVVGLIATLLPWHSTTIPTLLGANSGGHNAFGYWSGWIFFLAVLVGLVLIGMRTLAPQVSIPALPFTDSMIQLGIGVVMLLCAVLWLVTGGGYASVYAVYSHLTGYSSGPSIGVFVAIIAGIVVTAGGYLMKADPQPVTAPLASHPALSSSRPPAMPPPAAPPPPTA